VDLLERTIREVKEESAFVVEHLQFWWNGMSLGQQAFSMSIVCAAFLLIGVLQPAPKKASMLGNDLDRDMSTFKVFLLAAVILIIMTFGLDIAIEGIR